MKQLSKTLTLLLLLLYTETGVCSGASLNAKFASCHFPNCTLRLHGEHIVYKTLVVHGWEYFELTASEQTTVRCNMPSEENTVIRADNNKHVSLENITFIGCSQSKLMVDADKVTSILNINSTISFYMNSCYFPEYRKVGLTVNNTDRVVLTNSYFTGADDMSYKRAVLYTSYSEGNASFYSSNLTLDRSNTSISIKLSVYHSYKSQQNEVGGSLGIFMYNKGSVSITISDSFFNNSGAVLGGGAFCEISRSVSNYSIMVTGSHFENNFANKSKVGKGGAMAVRSLTNGGIIKIHNSTFRENKAISGGAIAILLNGVGDTRVELDGSSFRNNSGLLDSGGAIYAENVYVLNENILTIRNSSFHGNTANSGGAILTMNFQIEVMDDVSISENVGYYGGGMCLLSSNLNFSGSNIVLEKNHANHSGGALYLHSTSSLEASGYQTQISNNTAMVRGGGVFVFTKNFQNQVHNSKDLWRDKGLLFSYKCFIKSFKENRTTLIFSDNNVTSTTDLCMGDDLFTNTWGSCYKPSQSKENPINPSILFKDRAKNNCSIALDIVKYNKYSHFLSPCQLYYTHSPLNFTKNCSSSQLDLASLPDYNTRLEEAIKNISVKRGEKVHVFYPGYESQIDIESLDGLGNPIQTLTQVVFKPANETSHQGNRPYGMSTSGNLKFAIYNLSASDEFIFGKICLISYNTLNVVQHCEYALIGGCLSPLLRADKGGYCELWKTPRFQGHTFNEVKKPNSTKYIQMTPGNMFYYTSKNETILAHCTWFQCNCHKSATKEGCVFNLNTPELQCRKALKFPHCTECKDPNKAIVPPFTWSSSACSECTQPYTSIASYLLLTLIITGIIYILPVDVFSNYIRTIVFYSNILYVLFINCGTYVDKPVYKTLIFPVVTYNLKVSNMFEFCPPGNKQIYRAIFDMIAPWIFVVYILLIWLAVEKLPCASIRKLGQYYNAINKIWTIIILAYINLCNQAFSVLRCPENSKGERNWLYGGDVKCLVGVHLVASCIAILTLFVLTTFPLIMIITSYSENRKQYVLVYEGWYRTGFKKVEMFKLYIRIIFTFFVTLLPYHIPTLPCSLIAMSCLILLILNSLFKPATDEMANHYESLCLLILACVGLQEERMQLGKTTLSFFILIPYIIHLLQLLWFFGCWLKSWLKTLQERWEKIRHKIH